LVFAIEREHGEVERDAIGEVGVGEQQGRFGVVEQEADPFFGVYGIEGDIGGACLPDGKQGDHHGKAALQAEGDAIVGPDSQIPQIMRQLIGLAVEFAVAELPVFQHHRRGFGSDGYLLFKQLVRAEMGREGSGGVVPFVGNPPIFLGSESIDQILICHLSGHKSCIRNKTQQPSFYSRNQVGSLHFHLTKSGRSSAYGNHTQ
jgi:hypothetical protein